MVDKKLFLTVSRVDGKRQSQVVNTKHKSTRAALLALCIMLLAPACAAGEPGPASYGSKVTFKKNTAISFPDFELTYLGRRHVDSPKFKPGFNYEDFRVSRGKETITVSWSSGIGLLGPQEFEFGGRKFELELRHRDKLGWLKDDEVVVAKK